jgi:hypothetical protein
MTADCYSLPYHIVPTSTPCAIRDVHLRDHGKVCFQLLLSTFSTRNRQQPRKAMASFARRSLARWPAVHLVKHKPKFDSHAMRNGCEAIVVCHSRSQSNRAEITGICSMTLLRCCTINQRHHDHDRIRELPDARFRRASR